MDGLREGAKLDRYIIGEVLGAGGMATVYRARHESLGTEVALKVLAGNFTQNVTVRERFRQEGYVQANLHHPNIVRVTDLIDTPDVVAFAMELCDGPSLREYLDTHPGGLSWEQAKPILEGICAGVGFAHERGVLHRDIKPANVLLVEQAGALAPRVTDFGLARLLSGKGMTRTGTQMGTQTRTPARAVSRNEPRHAAGEQAHRGRSRPAAGVSARARARACTLHNSAEAAVESDNNLM